MAAEIGPEVTTNYALLLVLDSIYADLVTLKNAHNTLAAKLNADGGVSDTDYASTVSIGTTHA